MRQRQTIRFDRGLGHAEDQRVADLGSLRTLSGARVTRSGRLEKRRGFTAVDLTAAPGGTLTPFQVATLAGEPVLLASLGEPYPTGLWVRDPTSGEWLPAGGGNGSAYGLPLVTGVTERQPILAAGEPSNPKAALDGDVLCVVAKMARADSALSPRDCLQVQLYRVTADALVPLRTEQLDAPRTEFGCDVVATGSGFLIVTSRPGNGPPGELDVYSLSEASPLTFVTTWAVAVGGTIGRFAIAWDGSTGAGVATALGDTASFWAFNAAGTASSNSTRVIGTTLRNVAIAKRGNLFAAVLERRISSVLFLVDAVVGSASSIAAPPTISAAGTDLLGTGGAGSAISVDNDRSPVSLAMLPTGSAVVIDAAVAIERTGPEVVLYRLTAANATTAPALVGVTGAGSGGGSRISSARLDGHPVVATTATIADAELALDEILLPVVRGEAPGQAWQLWAPGALRDTIDAHLDELSASPSFGGLDAVGRGVRLATGRLVFPRLRLDDQDRPALALTEIAAYGNGYALTEADGQLLLTGGGITFAFDGTTFAELGWLGRPYLEDVSASVSGSLSDGDGYTMAAVWAFVDSRGRVHRSAPSNPIQWTQAGTVGRIVRATLPSTWRSRRRAAGEPRPTIQIEFYRTIGDGLNFLLDGAEVVLPDDSLPADGRFVLHTTTQSDDALQGVGATTYASRPSALYTEAQAVEHGAPRPASLAVFADGRLMVAGGRTFQVSFQLEPGEPLVFPGPASLNSPNFTGECPEPVVALGALDERFLLFGARGVYVVGGVGPDRNGNGAYLAPVRLPTAGGCASPTALLELPPGLLADLSGRLSLLPRGNGSPLWLGERARDAFDGRRVVAAAVRLEAWEAVLSLDDGTSLAYDLRADAWSTDVLPANAISVAEVGSRLWALSGVLVFEENAAVGADIAATITVAVNSVPLSGPVGWGEANELGLLATYRGDCVVRARYTRDDFRTLELAGGDGERAITSADYAVGDPVVLHWTPPEDAAQRVGWQLEIECDAGSDGVWLNALSIEAEAIPGRARGKATQDG
jgi:hypothetical protein